MKKIPFLISLAATALVATGCTERPTLISDANKTLAFRLIASSKHDAALVGLAQSTSGSIVKQNGAIVAEWVPVAPNSPADSDLGLDPFLVVRKAGRGTELLVKHLKGDLTKASIAHIAHRGWNKDGDSVTAIAITNSASRPFFRFTMDHVGRRIGVITDGSVQAVPNIKNPVRKEIVLTRRFLEKVSVLKSPDQ